MASNYVQPKNDDINIKYGHHHHHHNHNNQPATSSSPRYMRRSLSSASSTCSQGAAPKCVCAPPTHAGSFKCRLHRVKEHGHGPTSPTTPNSNSAPIHPGPPAAVSSSSTRTVEAQ